MTTEAQHNTTIAGTVTQRPARAVQGGLAAAMTITGLAAGIALISIGAGDKSGAAVAAGIVLVVVVPLLAQGLVVVQPNESKVLIVFGRYTGTILESGLWWVNPLSAIWRQTVSLRVRNFQGAKIKVNDASGNPIEIAAVIVWRVVDTAKAVFDVEDFESFVVIQSETAVRHLAAQFPYDDYSEDSRSLRRNTDEVVRALQSELQQRLDPAGIEVLETRVTHLAYAAEIAEVMLRRQQAEAILAARQTMVNGAVGLVQMALEQLDASSDLELDPERKASMAANLMIVLSGDHSPTPVINTGSLYT
jgi:regulator of protease activity HflC (stomatin/prohibitin superfamily)